MQLLVVHRDADVGATLVRMVKEFTPHDCHLVNSDAAAVAWSEEHEACDLLLTQLEAEGIDGFSLGGSLSEKFPQLQTLFMPPYPASEQRLDVVNTKVFPEPIDGERVLNAITRAEAALTRGADLFHVVDVLQMCCLSKKGGAVQLLKVQNAGCVFFKEGNPVHAETSASRGTEALCEMVAWEHVEFAYDADAAPTEITIEAPWEQVLIEAVLRHKQEKHAYDRSGKTSAQAGPLTGKQFGNYLVGRKLTESFWDEVYEAQETGIGRTAALHVIRSELRGDARRAEEFLADARVNANVDHPAIVSVYEAGESDGTYFYAREFVVGDTLEEIHMRGQMIPEQVALRIITAVAEALSYLDRSKILHAPLRISRILVSSDGRARLADIAVASPAAAQTGPPQVEIQMLGRILLPLVKPAAAAGSGRVVSLIHRMHSGTDNGAVSWEALLQEARAIEPEIVPDLPVPSPQFQRATPGLLGKFKTWRIRR
jgi:CheY-like chemotaxis protein